MYTDRRGFLKASIAAAVAAAKALNSKWNTWEGKKGMTPEILRKKMWEAQLKYSRFGASDSEVNYVIRDLIKQRFGLEIY